jgi:hypothetical protein
VGKEAKEPEAAQGRDPVTDAASVLEAKRSVTPMMTRIRKDANERLPSIIIRKYKMNRERLITKIQAVKVIREGRDKMRDTNDLIYYTKQRTEGSLAWRLPSRSAERSPPEGVEGTSQKKVAVPYLRGRTNRIK